MRIDIKEFEAKYPYIMKKVLKGERLVITRNGKELFAIVPMYDIHLLETFEMDELEHKNPDLQNVTDLLKKIDGDVADLLKVD